MGKQWKQWQTLFFFWSKITADGDCSHEIKTLSPWEESYDQPRQHVKKQKHYFVNKGPSNQGYGFSSGPVWMWELDYKENWAPKTWYFWTVVLEKTLESPLDCKEVQPVHPKGDQSWVFIGRTDVEAETPILWPPDVKSWLIWKDPDAGKEWGQEEKGTTEDETVGWHHRFNGHGSGWTLEVSDGQGGLACCGSWGHKESDMTERLNWTDDFSSSQVWMWDLDPKEDWVRKNWCFQPVMLEKTLDSPLESKQIELANPKGTHPEYSLEGLMLKLTFQCFGNWCKEPTHWKNPDAGKYWQQVEKGMTEDEMVEWHHQFNGYKFEQASGDGEGQGSLACCSPWCCRVRHNWATEQQGA